MAVGLMVQGVVAWPGWVGHHMVRWQKSQIMGGMREAFACERDQEPQRKIGYTQGTLT